MRSPVTAQTTWSPPLSIRKVPELRFQRDRSLENAQRIEQILSEVIVPEKKPDPEADDS